MAYDPKFKLSHLLLPRFCCVSGCDRIMQENLHQFVLLIFSFLLFNLHSVNSEIQTAKISSDPRPFIPLQDFGFGNEGYISVSVSSVSITESATSKSIRNPVTLSFIGCFYAPSLARQALKHALLKGDICLINKPFIFPLIIFNEKIVLSKSHFKTIIPVTIPDLYYIFFVNCAENSSVSATVKLETYNVAPNGDPDYLDDQFTPLPTILSIFAILYFCFVITWSYMCYESKPSIHKIHILMATLLFFRFLELTFHANSYNSIKHSGLSHGWNILWFTTYVARSIIFTITMMLIGAGWSLFKPILQELKKYTMEIAVLVQVISCVCFILIRTIGQSDMHYRHWIITYYATDFLCCITITVPVRASLQKLHVNSMEGKDGRKMAIIHKKSLENFAAALYVYVGFTRLALFVLRSISSYKFWCLTIAVELLIEFLFYMLVHLMFWPNDGHEYSVVDGRKEETNSIASPGGYG